MSLADLIRGKSATGNSSIPEQPIKSSEEIKREQRREKVLRMLEESPGIQRAFVTDTMSDRDNVILTLAIRGAGTCELEIPKRKYDPFLLLAIIERTVVQ
jgi:hypothetical protein